MAKNDKAADAATTETAAAAVAESTDQRYIVLNVPAGDPSGLEGQQKRTDVIRALARTGEWTRGDIAKHVTKLQFPNGDGKVAYQIVFQATKGMENVKAAQRGATGEGETAPAEGGEEAAS